MEKINLETFHARLDLQKQHREDLAFVCPVCGTVQSMRSLARAGVPAEKLETQIGFSCEGRWTNAGPWPKNPSITRRAVRGCDWTLGGFFRIHDLEVIDDQGAAHPMFAIASPEQAEALRTGLDQ